MKKSEYIEMRRKNYAEDPADVPVRWAEHDAEAAEAAGVAWDPETVELPEKLQAYRVDKEWYLAPDDSDWPSPAAKARGYLEAKRRYNAWPELERLAEEIGYTHIVDRLRKILESGK